MYLYNSADATPITVRSSVHMGPAYKPTEGEEEVYICSQSDGGANSQRLITLT